MTVVSNFFDNIDTIILMFPLTAIIPVLLTILIIRNSRNKNKLKKCCLMGFFIFTVLSILSEVILYIDTIDVLGFLEDNFGGFVIVYFYEATQVFCFISGITLLIAYIVLAVYEKKHPVQETELQEVSG